MKKPILIAIACAILAAGVLLALTVGSGTGPGALPFLSPDRAMLTQRTYDFLEDIKFKDFAKASTYHLAKTQEKRDIPELLRRVFGIKHEVLDITSFQVLEVDFDRGGRRARVRTQVFFRVLGDQKVRENVNNNRNVEILFYWFQQPDDEWIMELESSLR
ncbi:MAG: hypothetical protein IPK13_24270 [Deltaproteobacteria bacterium]|nr:hypothetical protein [Deltaproteobacteria bacterium]